MFGGDVPVGNFAALAQQLNMAQINSLVMAAQIGPQPSAPSTIIDRLSNGGVGGGNDDDEEEECDDTVVSGRMSPLDDAVVMVSNNVDTDRSAAPPSPTTLSSDCHSSPALMA